MRSSLQSDGRHRKIVVADVDGRFTRWRRVVFALLMLLYFAVPSLTWHGAPLLQFDLARRILYLGGAAYNAQDTYLLFFFITGLVFTLFFLTAVAGRVWCGWACPQTVWIEGVFRRIERWVEGPRQMQLQRVNIFRRAAKHFLFVVASLGISVLCLRFFVVGAEWWVWWLCLAALLYGDGAWFREQVCVFLCPYGRIQSALIDNDTLVIGYDTHRGEPRGKKNAVGRGHCIDCQRCVDVCPTGIDIRHGLQLECIGCANCIDACDAIMQKIDQPAGLIRYDSLRGFAGNVRRIWRPRLWLYTALLVAGVAVAGGALHARHNFSVNVLRASGLPYVLDGDRVRNQFFLHITNRSMQPATFALTAVLPANVTLTTPIHETPLNALSDIKIPIFLEMSRAAYRPGIHVPLQIRNAATAEIIDVVPIFLGP